MTQEKKPNPKNSVFYMDISIYLEIVKLAQEHGKKPGDSMQEEFLEILKKKRKEIEYLGNTDKDKDLLLGDLREEGLKIFDLDEERRKKDNGRKRKEKGQ